MANLFLNNATVSQVNEVVSAISDQFSDLVTRISSQASYNLGVNITATAIGDNFSYDVSGKLVDGNITELRYFQFYSGSSGIGLSPSVRISGFLLPVQQVIALASVPGGAAPALLAGADTVRANSRDVSLYDGDDTVAITIASPAVGIAPRISVDGGNGVDTAILRDTRGRLDIVKEGDATVVSYDFLSAGVNLRLSLLSIEELRFIDGVTYEGAATSGAQAALIFLGILGRLPDPVNAGGFDLLAQQSGTTAAAATLLATVEGQARTANLDNAGYVSRLYTNVLRRTPEASEVTGWQQALDNGVVTRAGAAALFAASPEARAVNAATFTAGSVFGASPNAVSALRVYQTVLNRPVEASSVRSIVEQLDSGTTTLAILENTAVTSPEFNSLLGGATDNASFVNLLQRNVYGTADQATTNLWSNLLDRGRVTRGTVADAFAFSPGADAKVLPLVTNQGIAYLEA